MFLDSRWTDVARSAVPLLRMTDESRRTEYWSVQEGDTCGAVYIIRRRKPGQGRYVL